MLAGESEHGRRRIARILGENVLETSLEPFQWNLSGRTVPVSDELVCDPFEFGHALEPIGETVRIQLIVQRSHFGDAFSDGLLDHLITVSWRREKRRLETTVIKSQI